MTDLFTPEEQALRDRSDYENFTAEERKQPLNDRWFEDALKRDKQHEREEAARRERHEKMMGELQDSIRVGKIDWQGSFSLDPFIQRAESIHQDYVIGSDWISGTDELLPATKEQSLHTARVARDSAIDAIELQARAALEQETEEVFGLIQELERVQVADLRKTASRVSEFERAAILARLRGMTPAQVLAWARSEQDPAVRLVLSVDGPAAVRGLPKGEGDSAFDSWQSVAHQLEQVATDPREEALRVRASRLADARRRLELLDPERYRDHIVQTFDIRPAM